MTTTELDIERVEEFTGRLVGVFNDGMLCLAISLGHQTGLFDTMATLPASTSAEVAKAASLQERYVREILGSLVTGGIVTYDPAAQTYLLPDEHAAVMTRAAGVGNLAAYPPLIALLGSVEGEVLRCFREGGGVPYSSFDGFHRMMAEWSHDTIDATLLTSTLDLVPGLRDRLEEGIDVADVGCGSGYAMNVLARAFPKSRFTGYDFCEEPIEAAQAQAAAWRLDNVAFEVRDVTNLGLDGELDLVTTFDAVHDQANPASVLSGIATALRDDGTYLCIDVAASSNLEDNIEHPMGAFLYTVSTMHCMTVSLALDGAGLGTAWGEQLATTMLGEAGFTDVRAEHLDADPLNVYFIARKG